MAKASDGSTVNRAFAWSDPATARDVLHNHREAVVVRIGMGRKASFCSQ